MMENLKLNDVGLDENLTPLLNVDNDAADEFYFESESFALMQNKDYQRLIGALVKLEAQKVQAIKGLEDLYEAEQKILKNPLAFAEALQNGENFDFPDPIKIAEVPDIDWSKYEDGLSREALGFTKMKLRRGSQTLDKKESNTQPKNLEDFDTSNTKPKNPERSETFNKPWTPEEQRKLEELLIKYPEERFSLRRWAKISRELGTRTTLQVQSHVQKFFKVLKTSGLPIPGRNPKCYWVKQRNKKRTFPLQPSVSSSFTTAFKFETGHPASSSDERHRMEYRSPMGSDLEVSDEEDLEDRFKNTPEYREFIRLKRAKKLKQMERKTGKTLHYGFKCDGCGETPISGTRWHCLDCEESLSVDLCGGCAAKFESPEHRTTHVMKPVKRFSLAHALYNPAPDKT